MRPVRLDPRRAEVSRAVRLVEEFQLNPVPFRSTKDGGAHLDGLAFGPFDDGLVLARGLTCPVVV